jgi:Fic family protein
MRSTDFSPDRRRFLVPVPDRPHIRALVPPPCPRALDVRAVMAPLLAAERAIARLAAIAQRLPRPDLITRSLERREAVLSSQIEGTQTDLTQLMEYEATGSDDGLPKDAAITLGYVRALDHGLRAVRTEGRLTLDLIRALHLILTGPDYPYPEGPGEWRRGQNWIGLGRIEDARLVPPPVSSLPACLADLQDFLQGDADSLIELGLPLRIAVVHAQFEAIHPFSDGNGRVGRLLPPLMLAAEGLPPLYLAGYLKARQRDYYSGLSGVERHGRWTDWLTFFLEGVVSAADTEQATAEALLALREDWARRTVQLRSNSAARRLLDVLLGAPVQTAASARVALGVSIQAATNGLAGLVRLGILREATGRRWGRSFQAHEVIAILEQPMTIEP